MGSLKKFFGSVRQKIVERKSWSPLQKVFSIPEVFRYTELLQQFFFGTMRQKNFDRKSWHNALKHKFFWYPKEVTHLRVPYEIFRHLDQNFLTDKTVILPPPSCLYIFFETKTIQEHRKVPLRSFSVLWDKKLSTESHDPPLQKVFLIPEVFRYTELLQQFLWYCETKKVQQKILT